MDIGKINNLLESTFEGIGEAVYINQVPKAHVDRHECYVMVQMRNSVDNQGAWQRTYVTIHLVARDRKSGLENGEAIDRMVKQALERFPIVSEGITIISPEVVPWRRLTGFSYATISAQMIY